MKLIVEITFLDDKKQSYECTDFPYPQGDFFVLCLPRFKREFIRTSTIAHAVQYFK